MKKIKNLLKKTNQCKGCLIIPCPYPSFVKKSVKNDKIKCPLVSGLTYAGE